MVGGVGTFLLSDISVKSNAEVGARKSSTVCLGFVSSMIGGSAIGEVLTLIEISSSATISLRIVFFGFGVAFGLVEVFILVTEVVGRLFEPRVTSPSIDLFSFIVYNYNMTKAKLTKKQLAVLDFLRDFTDENGYSPSYREIMNGLGLSSVSAVAEHIDNLVARGALKKVPGAARSLEILDYKHTETVELFKVKLMDCTDEERATLMAAAEILDLDLE